MSKNSRRPALAGAKDMPVAVSDGNADKLSDNKGPLTTLDALSRQPAQKRSQVVLEVDINACRLWKMADRKDEGVTKKAIEDLAQSIREQEQRVPVIARPVEGDPQIKYEIVAGRRRFEACKLIGKNILAIVKSMDDQEAFAVMMIENDDRIDISPFTRALSLRSALDEGIYESQTALLEAHNEQSSHRKYTKGNISKMLTAARLTSFDFIWRHIDHPSTIAVDDARRLVIALEGDHEGVVSRRVVAKLARINSSESRDALTDGQIIADLLRAALTLDVVSPVVHEAARGGVTVKGVLKAGKYVVTAQGDLSKLNDDDFMGAVKDLYDKIKQ
ncbi:ParB/RepB/Spo0J family partition protein [Alcanivorax sp. 1008]|uniref:ParB/RepB/Spo0J family partition protein n=1 Tax=Alcanivorax sp. 1008 TaxID=2816853 RepID=UPI001E07F1E0|nr:ParB/RepB/Spo0J family partition protein [Alcanivorax sp. 1008]MCC1496896.1 ParB/RepB/Spo0J family partition protein [Alcanivorax sp. 1008]